MADRRDRDRDREHGDQRPLRKRRKKVCIFCADKIVADYKNLELIRRFVTDRGKIGPRRATGCCAKHQRAIATEIKRARQIGTLPFVVD